MRYSVRLPNDPGDRVTLLGILCNVLLMAIKLVAGFLIGSAALIADGIHSTSDMATDLAVLGGMRLGRRKADADHPYGHGRYETLAGGAVAAVLILVGAFITWNGIVSIYRGVLSFPGSCVVVIAAISILVKEWLYHRTVRVARDVGSAALQANAWHHRSDALSSVAVLAGGMGGLVGWGHADQLAGLIVGLMVITAGGRTLVHVLRELTEGGLSTREVETIETAIQRVDAARAWHQLRTRRVGRETFVDVHVVVDSALSVVDAHRVSMEVEDAIHQACERPVNVIVHVEPDTPELDAHQKEEC
jgi:cation diffusion facilitator family transporter